MNVSPININNNYNRPSFGNAKQQFKSKAKQLAVPLIGLSTLVIAPSCDSRKPYDECTKVEADSLYRQEHAKNYKRFPDDRFYYTEECPCTSCDSARVVFAEQDSIANVEKQKAERLQHQKDSIAEAKRVQAEKKEAEQAKFCQKVVKNINNIWKDDKVYKRSSLSYEDGSFIRNGLIYKKTANNKWEYEGQLLTPSGAITINKHKDSSYDVILTAENSEFNRSYSFTKDHRYKDEQYYAEIEAKKQKAHFEESAGELVSLDLFKGINKEPMSKVSSKLKIDNVEYIEKGNGVYNLFFNKDGVGYDLLLKKTGKNGEFAGMARKLLANGESELYIFKTEHFETNKSDKIRVSKMQVIQDGLDDSSPTTKKGLHETKKSGENVTYTTNDLNGKSRMNMIIPAIPNFFAPGTNYDGKATSNAIHKINEFITESNAEGKVITVYSCPKNSDVVEMNGQVIK